MIYYKSGLISNAENFEFIFRYYWSLGPHAPPKTRRYLNLLVANIIEKNGLTVSETINEIFINNGDLPGISHWNLKNNLNEQFRKLYRRHL